MNHRKTVLYILILLIGVMSGNSTMKAQSEKKPKIRDVRSEWKLGSSWQLKISQIALEESVPAEAKGRDSWPCSMSVVHVPTHTQDFYVLKLLVNENLECLFFVIDSTDLSLLELRKLERDRIETMKKDSEDVTWKDADLIHKYPGGVPVIIFTDFIRMAFPVFDPQTANPRNVKQLHTVIQEHSIKLGEKNKLIFEIYEESTTEAALKSLRQNDPADYRLIWVEDMPWWRRCGTSSESDYRIELINAQDQDE